MVTVSEQDELAELQEHARTLEEEVLALRRRLQDAPKRVRTLEERLLETKGQLSQAVSQNEKLTYTLREARDHIAALREEVDKLTQPPSAYGTLLGHNDDGTVDVFTGGRKVRVAVHPELSDEPLDRGAEVVLNESLNVVLARSAELTGEVVTFKERLDDTRVLIVGRADEERVVELLDELRDVRLRNGDTVLLDSRSGLVLEKLPRPEVEDLALEEVPDIGYEDIGGLDDQIEMIADAVELPFLHQDLFAEHELPAPKGILLYGPPGCGKTLIAKAVANSLAKKVAAASGQRHGQVVLLQHQGPRAPQQVRRRDRAPDPARVPAGAGEERGGLAGHRLLRRDGLDVPHPRHRHQLRHGEHDRAAAPRGDRRRRDAEERHHHRRLQPRGPDRPRHPPARAAST